MGFVRSFCNVSCWAWREGREEKVGEREMEMDGWHSCKRGGMKQESRDRQNGGEEEACLAEAVAFHVGCGWPCEPPPLPFLPHHTLLWIGPSSSLHSPLQTKLVPEQKLYYVG